MTLDLELSPEADAEFELYRRQYETQRKGLGAEFLIEVDRAAVRVIAVAPQKKKPRYWRSRS